MDIFCCRWGYNVILVFVREFVKMIFEEFVGCEYLDIFWFCILILIFSEI